MPTPTYTPLATLTLSSAASIVSFTSIGQSYRDLILVVNIAGVTGTVTNDGAGMRVNADAGANYNEITMSGNGSTTTSFSNVSSTKFALHSTESSTPSITKIDFLDYSATDKHKTALMRGNRSDNSVMARALRWASTSAITSITLYAPDYFSGTVDTWNAGSSFALYGIAS